MSTSEKPLPNNALILLLGVPALVVNYIIATLMTSNGIWDDLFDYYTQGTPAVFLVLLWLSYTKRSSMYAVIALLLAVVPLVGGIMYLFFF